MGNVYDRPLCVAVHKQVGATVEQDGTAYLVAPVIVMGNASQAGFDAAHYQRNVPVSLPHALAVDDDRAVGTLAALVVGRVGVVVSAFPVCRVAVDHGVHVARSYTEEQVGLAESLERFCAGPIWLGDNAYAEPLGLQYATDHCHPEARVIHVSVSGHQDDVTAVPAQRVHLLPCHGQFWRRAETFGPVFTVGVDRRLHGSVQGKEAAL